MQSQSESMDTDQENQYCLPTYTKCSTSRLIVLTLSFLGQILVLKM